MTIHELQEILSKFPQHALVVIQEPNGLTTDFERKIKEQDLVNVREAKTLDGIPRVSLSFSLHNERIV